MLPTRCDHAVVWQANLGFPMDYEGELFYMKSSPGASQTEDFAEAWGNTSTAAALETKQDVRVMAHDRVAQAAAHEARAMALADEWAMSGSVLFVVVDHEVAAVLLMADSLKPEAAATVAALKSLGVGWQSLEGGRRSGGHEPRRGGATGGWAVGQV